METAPGPAWIVVTGLYHVIVQTNIKKWYKLDVYKKNRDTFNSKNNKLNYVQGRTERGEYWGGDNCIKSTQPAPGDCITPKIE